MADAGLCEYFQLVKTNGEYKNFNEIRREFNLSFDSDLFQAFIIQIASLPPSWDAIPLDLVTLPTVTAHALTLEALNIVSTHAKNKYEFFVNKKRATPVAKQRKYLLEFGFDGNLTYDWSRIYLNTYLATIQNKLKCFQFIINTRCVATNEILFKIGAVSDNKCVFCKAQTETIIHLLISCENISESWMEVLDFIYSKFISAPTLNSFEILLGTTCPDKNAIINCLVLCAKFAIYTCMLDMRVPTFGDFLRVMRETEQIEFFTARHRNKLSLHRSKWAGVL